MMSLPQSHNILLFSTVAHSSLSARTIYCLDDEKYPRIRGISSTKTSVFIYIYICMFFFSKSNSLLRAAFTALALLFSLLFFVCPYTALMRGKQLDEKNNETWHALLFPPHPSPPPPFATDFPSSAFSADQRRRRLTRLTRNINTDSNGGVSFSVSPFGSTRTTTFDRIPGTRSPGDIVWFVPADSIAATSWPAHDDDRYIPIVVKTKRRERSFARARLYRDKYGAGRFVKMIYVPKLFGRMNSSRETEINANKWVHARLRIKSLTWDLVRGSM